MNFTNRENKTTMGSSHFIQFISIYVSIKYTVCLNSNMST
uniref:Uncharacterized protein n=1 Tax=Anguilla anguilla TaxID=7936 RepID=A0A0E9Q7S8_ANGAN